MRMRHQAVGLLVGLLSIVALAACGSSSSTTTSAAGTQTASTQSTSAQAAGTQTAGSKDPVVFNILSIQAPGVTLLPDLTVGATTAAKAINNAGGFGGRPIVLHTCNTMSNTSASTECARKTVGGHPIAEFGCETSWSGSGLPIYAAAKVPSFNCANTPEDFHNPWSFSLGAGAVGDLRGLARYLCSQPQVKNVTMMLDDLPTFHVVPPAVAPILQACGKHLLAPEFYPLAAVDMAPFVTHVVQAKPDFVLLLAIGPQVVQIFKAFQQAGFPASKIGGPDTDFTYDSILKPAGAAMDGAYAANQYVSWGDTSNPDVAAYLKAMKASGADPTNATVEWGYAMMQWFYTAAKRIGFAAFNAQTLAHFMNTQTNVPVPLSRTLINPGPPQYPQQKQPYVQISQWKGGKMTVVPTGPAKDGWESGF